MLRQPLCHRTLFLVLFRKRKTNQDSSLGIIHMPNKRKREVCEVEYDEPDQKQLERLLERPHFNCWIFREWAQWQLGKVGTRSLWFTTRHQHMCQFIKQLTRRTLWFWYLRKNLASILCLNLSRIILVFVWMILPKYIKEKLELNSTKILNKISQQNWWITMHIVLERFKKWKDHVVWLIPIFWPQKIPSDVSFAKLPLQSECKSELKTTTRPWSWYFH